MNNDELRNIIWKHIHSIHVCMMITMDGSQIRGRPMTGIARPETNSIWFFSDITTHKDEEIRKNPSACLTFADIQDRTFVSVSGHLNCVSDTGLIHDLWNEGAATYFPDGPDDPNIVLLKFTPENGEYWDSSSSTIVMAIKFLEAKVTGERPDLGTNGSAILT